MEAQCHCPKCTNVVTFEGGKATCKNCKVELQLKVKSQKDLKIKGFEVAT